jgi:tetratricopeptide (TPR) repeat protein
LNAALAECAALSDGLFHVKADLLRDLSDVYSKEKRNDKAESAYRLRLEILTAHQKVEAPDLNMGSALFDLQSLYEATSRDSEAQDYFERTRDFYERCKNGFPDLRARCDRFLADAEGLRGSGLFLQKRFDEAVPLLQAVIARADVGVRPEVLHAALSAYAQILLSQGDTASARPFIERALRISAANPALFPYRSSPPERPTPPQ